MTNRTDGVDETYRRRVDALDATWRRWAGLGRELDDGGWSAPTRCTGWDVGAQFAHVAMFPPAVVAPPAVPEDYDGATVTAVELVRGFNAPGGVAHEMADRLAEAAVATAAGTGRDRLVEVYSDEGARAVESLRAARGIDLLLWPAAGAAMAHVEAVRIVLMESVVHLLDVLDALELPPDLPPDALRETAAMLAELADPVALIEAAAGRVEHSPLPVLR